MVVALRSDQREAKTESEKLKQLKDEAAEIRKKHEAGQLTNQEAVKNLGELKKRYMSVIDLLF